jgi:EAL domain-containing protein (putative c-di-GMP-specific phosphodiesterase class I)
MNDAALSIIPPRTWMPQCVGRMWSWHRMPYRLEPVVSLSDGTTIGAEILRDGLQKRLNIGWKRWYSQIGRVRSEGAMDDNLLFINLDTEQIRNPAIMQRLLNTVQDSTKVVLEWTELPSSLLQLKEASELLKTCRDEHGVKLCVDDFGAGVDGVQRLSLIRPDIVKCDGPMLHRARESSYARAVLKEVVTLIKDLEASAVIEWIETPDDLEIARESGADWGQGYLWPGRHGLL